MYCIKCGTQIPPDGRFCIKCGTPVANPDATAESPEPPAASSVPNPNVPNIPPYAPVNTQGQPCDNTPIKKKKRKALIIASAGAVAALALAAVLIFVVFAQMAGWPLSGDTLQTQFVNENFEVFALLNDEPRLDGQIMTEQPFEYSMTQTISGADGIDMRSEMDYVYDEKTLGSIIKQNDSTVRLLLIEDTLYINNVYDFFGSEYENTMGLKFDTDADLSKPMSFEERIEALLSGMDLDIDFKLLAEMFFNSISEDCFDKNSMRTTLKLGGEDLENTLRTFSDKLREEREIDDAFGEVIEKFSGFRMNLSSMLDFVTPQLSKADFEFVWTVRYDNGKPNRIEMSAGSGDERAFDLSVETRQRDDQKGILFELEVPGYYEDTTVYFDFRWQTAESKTEFKADMAVNDMEMTMSGTMVYSDYDYKVLMEMYMPLYDETVTGEITASILPGPPRVAVLDDERFKMNIDEATIIDLGDIASSFEQFLG